MSDPEFLNNLPEDVRTIVWAVSLRSISETEMTEQIKYEITGAQPEQPPTLETEMGQTVLRMAALGDENLPPEVRGHIAPLEVPEESELVQQWRDQGHEVEETVAHAEELHALTNEASGGAGTLDDLFIEELGRDLQAARAVASEQGVSIAEVYARDELYYEAARRSMVSLEQDAARRADLVQSVSLHEANRTESTASIQEVLRQTSLYSLTKTWGPGVMERLPDEQRQILQPERPLAPTVAELLAG